VAQDASFPDRREPFLVDVVQLGRTFRDRFVRGLGTLLRKGSLRLSDEWSQLHDSGLRRAWLKELRQTDWNVFISGPPSGSSDPKQVLKYLTRYMTGGPISDARIVGQSQDQVTFVARSKDKSQGHPPVEHTIPGVEFVRRWSLHILPKGFTRCRRYGGYHGSRSTSYLETCRDLLGLKAADQEAHEPSPERSQEQSPAAHHRPYHRYARHDRLAGAEPFGSFPACQQFHRPAKLSIGWTEKRVPFAYKQARTSRSVGSVQRPI